MAYDFNGHEYDFAHLKFAFLGRNNVKGIKGVKYKVTRESPNLYGAGGNPIAYGTGNKVYEGEITMMRSTVEDIRAAIQARLGDPNADLTDMPASDFINELGSGTAPTKTHILRAVRFTEDGLEGTTGDPELPLTIPIMFAGLLMQG